MADKYDLYYILCYRIQTMSVSVLLKRSQYSLWISIVRPQSVDTLRKWLSWAVTGRMHNGFSRRSSPLCFSRIL